MSKVDIVMPVHNRWKLTKQSLDSLLMNTPMELYTLYIINDGSDDQTSDELQKWFMESGGDNINLVMNDVAIAPGPSRNKICKQITDNFTRSHYLYHSDNDVYFREKWLETLLEFYDRLLLVMNVALLGGGCHPYLQDNRTFPLFNIDGTRSQYELGFKDAVSGYSQFMKWNVWDKYGPFAEDMKDADIKIMGSEDWAFCQRIIKDGAFVASIRPEVVIHCGKTNTYGNPATGHETFPNIPGIIIE